MPATSACFGGGGGSGTVTVVGSGNLTSTALVTGGGLQALQTPSATSTLDASGNLAVAAGGSLGSADTGTPKFTFATNKVTLNQPLVLGTTSNQLVMGTTTNLTTLTFPASSGAVTLTFPNTSASIWSAQTRIRPQRMSCTRPAVAGVGNFAAIAAGDLPAALSSSTSINKVTITAPATSATLTIADGTTLTETYSMNVAKTAGVAGAIPWYDTTTTESASALLTQYGVMIGGGASAAPSTIAADTTTTHALFATAGAPAFRAVAAGDIQATAIPPVAVPTPGTSITLAAPSGIAVCTGTCTVSVPVPAAGYQFCILERRQCGYGDHVVRSWIKRQIRELRSHSLRNSRHGYAGPVGGNRKPCLHRRARFNALPDHELRGDCDGELMKRLFVLFACLLAVPAQGQILSIIMGGTNQPAATPTFSPAAGAVTNPTTVTASTSTSDGCTIYFDTSNPPVTAQTTYSVTTGVTLYAQARGCAHHRDSLVGSATYTISSGTFTDNFPYSAGDLVAVSGGNWTYPSGSSSVYSVVTSGEIKPNQGTGHYLTYWSGAGSGTFTATQHASITVGSTALSPGYAGPAVLVSSSATTGYFAQCYSGGCRLEKIVAGSNTVETSFAGTLAAGDVIKLGAVVTSCTSVVLTWYQNGTSIGTWTDSSSPICTGNPGMYGFNSGGSSYIVSISGGNGGTINETTSLARIPFHGVHFRICDDMVRANRRRQPDTMHRANRCRLSRLRYGTSVRIQSSVLHDELKHNVGRIHGGRHSNYRAGKLSDGLCYRSGSGCD